MKGCRDMVGRLERTFYSPRFTVVLDEPKFPLQCFIFLPMCGTGCLGAVVGQEPDNTFAM